jgi:glycosyltransferase involved in cell wall biosynthesis
LKRRATSKTVPENDQHDLQAAGNFFSRPPKERERMMELRKGPLIVHTECSDGWGGQEIRIMEEMRGMRRRGLNTALIAPGHSLILARARKEGFPAYPVRFKNKGHLPSWISLFPLLKRLRPDILNTHSSDDSWMAGFAGRILRIPIIVRTRHVSTPIGSTFSYRFFSDYILTTSKAIRDDLTARGLPGERIYPVPTGIDSERFSYRTHWREEIRSRHGIDAAEVLVGNICVLRSWKGLDFFLETAALVKEKAFRFILVGDGPQRERLERKASGLGLGRRIIFAGHREDIEKYFSALDLFFFTSYANEGVPQSLLQARSVGVPMLACSTPSVVETLKGYRRVSFLEYGDAKKAIEALLAAAGDLTVPEAERREQNAWIRANHDLETMITTLTDLYARWGVRTDMEGRRSI